MSLELEVEEQGFAWYDKSKSWKQVMHERELAENKKFKEERDNDNIPLYTRNAIGKFHTSSSRTSE